MISILIPAYNVEKYIKTTINSVLSQTYKDIEIIVIDDCSTDNTPNIIQGIATLDKRIIFLKNDVNKGLTANRNLTLKRAKGEYIMFVDADDYLYPNAVEIMYTLAKKKNSDIVIGGSSYVQNPDNNQDFLSLKHFIFNPSHKPGYYNNRKFITDPTAVTLWSKLYKKSYLDGIDFVFDEKMKTAEDLIWSFYMPFTTNSVETTNEIVYIWNRHEGSSSYHENVIDGNHPVRIWNFFKICGDKIFNFLIEKNVFKNNIKSIGEQISATITVQYLTMKTNAKKVKYPKNIWKQSRVEMKNTINYFYDKYGISIKYKPFKIIINVIILQIKIFLGIQKN